MNVILIDKEAEVDIKHNCCISHKDMLHVIVLLRFIFIPNEISNKSLHYITITTHLLQKITLAFEHTLLMYIRSDILAMNRCLMLLQNRCLMLLQRNKILKSLALAVCFCNFWIWFFIFLE